MTAIPTITTDRLILRAPRRDDFDAYASMLGDARARYMGGPFSRMRAWDMFCNIMANWQFSGFGGWLIDTRADRMIGEVAIWQPDHYAEPELGWTLTPAGEGKGYAFEAATAARNWYWHATGAKTLVSYITPGNIRSEALARKLGAHPDPEAPLPIGETAADTIVYRHTAPSEVAA